MNKNQYDNRIWIHVDLVIEILSRSPVKTLLRLKCLSKEFARIIQSQNFVDSCLSCSMDRSRLLFYLNCRHLKKLVFFSTPNRSTYSISPTRFEMSVCGRVDVSLRSPPVRGLIFYTIGPNQHVICNPSTRQHLHLPQNKIMGKHDDMFEFLIFGYDPIFDEYKVLCMSGLHDTINQFWWVFTVGKYGNLWRKIQGKIPNHLKPVLCAHVCGQSGICINGFLYFRAYSRTPGIFGLHGMTTHVVSFDLNSEKFSLVEPNAHLSWFTKLIDFQGKLGFLSRAKDCEIEFSCLTDNKWSTMVFHLPWAPVYNSDWYKISNSVVGICDGEIVFVSPGKRLSGYTWHLSLEKNTIRKVKFEIPSIESYGFFLDYYFVNYVETTVSLR